MLPGISIYFLRVTLFVLQSGNSLCLKEWSRGISSKGKKEIYPPRLTRSWSLCWEWQPVWLYVSAEVLAQELDWEIWGNLMLTLKPVTIWNSRGKITIFAKRQKIKSLDEITASEWPSKNTCGDQTGWLESSRRRWQSLCSKARSSPERDNLHLAKHCPQINYGHNEPQRQQTKRAFSL